MTVLLLTQNFALAGSSCMLFSVCTDAAIANAIAPCASACSDELHVVVGTWQDISNNSVVAVAHTPPNDMLHAQTFEPLSHLTGLSPFGRSNCRDGDDLVRSDRDRNRSHLFPQHLHRLLILARENQ